MGVLTRQHILWSLAAGVLSGAPAAAQHAQQVELGTFGSYGRYDRGFGLGAGWGGGGRIGYLIGDRVGVEVDAGYMTPGASTAELWHGSASVVLNLRAAPRHVLFLLAGYTRLDFEPAPPYRFTDNAAHVGIGHRFALSPRITLRAEARAIYAPATRSDFGPSWAGHVVAALGLSVFAGRTPDHDRDGDGIPDRRDECRATPTGAVADPRGCPGDTDGDGVFDGLDACPHSPVAAPIDPRGCPLDADGDGVHDGADRCPATPAGARVEAHGCPSDMDGDGVADGLDACDGPPGALVDAAGCPVDNDGDQVPDGLDRCPDTRAGATVDQVGCPTARDTDGDGVDDPKDRCPATPAGREVDAAGCSVLFTPARTPVVLHGVSFESGRSALHHESFAILNEVATSLVANPTVRVEIAGHTDGEGSAQTNLLLSRARAAAVRDYLARRGVNPARLVARGYGESEPVASNETPEGRAQNRRVELRQIP